MGARVLASQRRRSRQRGLLVPESRQILLRKIAFRRMAQHYSGVAFDQVTVSQMRLAAKNEDGELSIQIRRDQQIVSLGIEAHRLRTWIRGNRFNQ